MSKRLTLIAVVVLAVALPNISESANTSGPCFGADTMCLPYVIQQCGCMQKMGKNGCEPDPNNKWKCTCVDTQTGTTGKCEARCKCKGESFTNQQGQQQGMGDAKGMMDALKGIMDMLKEAMKGGGDKGGGGQPQQQQQQPQEQGCTSYYQVSTRSTDKCAYYVPPTSDSLLAYPSSTLSNFSSGLFDALQGGANISESLGGGGGGGGGGETARNVSDQLNGITSEAKPESGSGKEFSGGEATPTPHADNLAQQAAHLEAGTHGNIEVQERGATVIAQARDLESNTEVAGFYGSEGAQPQSLVARMCQTRPWAKSVVSYIIPPTFFDSLCAWRGYQVGASSSPSKPVLQQSRKEQTTSGGEETPSPVSNVKPEVTIWAVPDKVPLGSRTSIFWNTKGVVSCKETSPDGNFNEETLSGGSATVPLSGETTFTISCLTENGTPISNYVTVGLSI